MRHKERPDGKNHKNKKIGHPQIMLDGSGQLDFEINFEVKKAKNSKTEKIKETLFDNFWQKHW